MSFLQFLVFLNCFAFDYLRSMHKHPKLDFSVKTLLFSDSTRSLLILVM